MAMTVMITSKTYQIEVPEWLWRRWTTVIDDRSEYSRYNDRILSSLASDLESWDDADLVDLEEQHRQRVKDIRADLAPAKAIPALNAPETDGRPASSSGAEPQG